MARTRIHIDSPPDEVFETISDPTSYERWLVGCKEVRAIESEWPRPQSRFHHKVGFGPLSVKDSTKVLDVDPGNSLVLEARARPAGIAHVEFRVEAQGVGTKITLCEKAGGRMTQLIWNRVVDRLVRLRNERSLKQLRALMEAA
jgi:uncharacterized protein YndB with AHSA1/START domain